MTIIQKPSPNQSPRKAGSLISAIVLHADAGKSDAGTIDWICVGSVGTDNPVSYHYLIGRDGKIYQFVPDAKKAWHAGVSVFHGVPNCNEYTLGISFANDQKGEPFTKAQIDAGVQLVAEKCRALCVQLLRVTTHAEVSPGRKHDPGPLFPLSDFLARVGAILAGTP